MHRRAHSLAFHRHLAGALQVPRFQIYSIVNFTESSPRRAELQQAPDSDLRCTSQGKVNAAAFAVIDMATGRPKGCVGERQEELVEELRNAELPVLVVFQHAGVSFTEAYFFSGITCLCPP